MNILYKTGLILFMLITAQTGWARSMPVPPWHSSNKIQVQTRLSQTKIVQHGANTVFVDMTFTPPEINRHIAHQRATDMIIILDRSGSMSEAKKMPYAKAAIWDVLGRLT
jgi:Ca-activated chloride channel family protein